MFSRETVLRDFNGKKVEQEVVFGVGRLTSNPPAVKEVGTDNKKFLSGNKDVNFSIALDKGKDKTEFFNLKAWDVVAENLAKLGYKGQPISIIARVEKSEYEGKTYESLVVERFQVLKYKDRDQSNEASTPEAKSDSVPAGATEVSQPDGSDDDIPF